MKRRTTRSAAPGDAIALALTWDGSRWPAKRLSAKARSFLADGSPKKSAYSAKTIAQLLTDDRVREIRLCWVPRLSGGDDVLTIPFTTPGGKRIGFRIARRAIFGEVLGVVYRRSGSRRRPGDGARASHKAFPSLRSLGRTPIRTSG
jgi:hypothetical protein